MTRRLWVIDPAVQTPEDEGFDELQRLWGGVAERFLVALDPSTPLPAGYGADALVILGSKASVNDDSPWIRELRRWLAPVVAGRQPLATLGICFGHQLLASIAGAPVGYLRADQSKRLGIEQTTIASSRLFPDETALSVICSHREVVRELPTGFRRIGSRAGVPNDVFEHEQLPIVSVQFHPEARGAFLARAGLDPNLLTASVVSDSQRLLRRFFDR